MQTQKQDAKHADTKPDTKHEHEVVTLSLVPETETRQLQTQASTMLAKVSAMPVSTPDEFKEAGAITIVIAKRRTEIKERLKVGVADIIHQGWKRALEVWQQVDAPYEQAEKILSGKLAAYHAAEEAKRRAAEAEAQRKAEEERQKQIALMKAAMEQARQAQIAITQAAEAGDVFADAPEVAPIVVPEVPVAFVAPIAPATKVEGLSFRTDWKWELVDIKLVPREYLMLNEAAVGGVVRSLKDKTNIPGIRAYPEQGTMKARK